MVVPAGAIVHKEKKIVAAFRAAGATSPDRATTSATLEIREGLAFAILRRHDIVRQTEDGRLYLDEPAWEAHRIARHRLALTIVGVVLLVGITVFLWFSTR